MGLLDWESSALTTRLLLHCSKFPPKLFVGQCGLTHIDHLRILYKFPPKQFVGQCSLTHIVHSRILCKFPPKLVFKYLSKNCIWDITVWSILSFHRSFSYTNFQQKLLFFLWFFFWCSKIYSKNFIRGNMVWPILSFQESYINVHLMLVYFLPLKIYWKIVSGTARFDYYFPFQGFYQVFIKSSCFLFCFKSL